MNDENKSFLKLRERRQSLGALYRSLSKADERPTQLQQRDMRYSVIINPFDLAGLHAEDKKLAAKKYANIIGPPLLDDYQDRLEELFEFKAEPKPAVKSTGLKTVASLAEFGNDQSKEGSSSQSSSSSSSSSESKNHTSNSKSGSGSEDAKSDVPNAQKKRRKHKEQTPGVTEKLKRIHIGLDDSENDPGTLFFKSTDRHLFKKGKFLHVIDQVDDVHQKRNEIQICLATYGQSDQREE